METFKLWASEWGNLASVAGLFLGLLGFGFTIFGVWRSKNAAQAAQAAATKALNAVSTYDAVTDLASAMATMDEVKRHQRQGAWHVLPDRYSHLRQRLISIKGAGVPLNDQQRQTIQGAIEQFAVLEKRIDRSLAAGNVPANPAKLNEIVSSQLDNLQSVLMSLQALARK